VKEEAEQLEGAKYGTFENWRCGGGGVEAGWWNYFDHFDFSVGLLADWVDFLSA